MKTSVFSWIKVLAGLGVLLAMLGILLASPSQDVQASELAQTGTGADQCATCHKPMHELWSVSKHGAAGLDCQVCHKLETGEGQHPFDLSFSTEPEELTCTVCHAEVTADWNSSRHGEVGMQCVSCHNPHSQQQKPLEGNLTTCENCHRTQKDAMHNATHTLAGADCITCHLGSHRKHTFHVDAATCATCHNDIHEANKLVEAGAEIARIGDAPMPVAEPEVADAHEEASGGVNLPSWLLLVSGLLLGGGLMWVFIGKEPGKAA